MRYTGAAGVATPQGSAPPSSPAPRAGHSRRARRDRCRARQSFGPLTPSRCVIVGGHEDVIAHRIEFALDAAHDPVSEAREVVALKRRDVELFGFVRAAVIVDCGVSRLGGADDVGARGAGILNRLHHHRLFTVALPRHFDAPSGLEYFSEYFDAIARNTPALPLSAPTIRWRTKRPNHPFSAE